jgi:hypothetical protein
VNNVFLECGEKPADPSAGTIIGPSLDSLDISNNYAAGEGFAPKTGAYLGRDAVNGGDPGLVSLSAGQLDLHSRPGGALVDRGRALAPAFGDRDGVPRPQGQGWDIGPCER